MAADPAPLLRSTGNRQADGVERAVTALGLAACAGIWFAGSWHPGWAGLLTLASVMLLAAAACGLWSSRRIAGVPARSFGAAFLEPGWPEQDESCAASAAALANAEEDLAKTLKRSQDSAGSAYDSAAAVVRDARALAGTVRETTGALRGMRDSAVAAAEAAQGATSALGELTEKAQPIPDMADRLHAELQRIVRLAQNAAADGQPGAEPLLAVREALDRSTIMLDTMLASVAIMQSATAAATERVQSLAAVVMDEAALNDGLSVAITSQGRAIAGLLAKIDKTQTDIGGLRMSVDTLAVLHRVRQDATRAAWRDVEQSPARAETMARLLRDLPAPA